MHKIEIPTEVSEFCVLNYKLIRDWIEYNEELKAEMTERFPHLKPYQYYPVFGIETFCEEVSYEK